VALKPVIYKLNLNLSDLNRNLYTNFNLTIAQHPSESLERMTARMMAFALNASEELSFTKGLSEIEEPDIWAKSLDDQIMQWIEVGEPAVDRVKKATRLAKTVKIYSFNSKSDVWWQQSESKFARLEADYFRFNNEQIVSLTEHIERTMQWYVTVTDNSLSINTAKGEAELDWEVLKASSTQ